MKTLGIILAAGKSSRLYPATLEVTKQMLPIYDKPLIYYPLSVLMLAGVKNFLIIASPGEVGKFSSMLYKSGLMESKDMTFNFAVQEKPTGIPDAFNITKEFFGGMTEHFDNFALILGDNIFHGASLTGILQWHQDADDNTASVFGTKVDDLERFGVAQIQPGGPATVVSIEEKPKVITDRKNAYALTGLYFFPKDVFDKAKDLKPSARGETEIVELIKLYHAELRLDVEVLPRGVVWFDTGTPASMLEASNYVATIQKLQGTLVCSPHEIGYNNGWYLKEQIQKYIDSASKAEYSQKLQQVIE